MLQMLQTLHESAENLIDSLVMTLATPIPNYEMIG